MRTRKLKLIIVAMITMIAVTGCNSKTQKIIKSVTIDSSISAEWKDTEGNLIQAHGGGFLKLNDGYYWFGEDRTTSSCQQINCYFSKNLKDWKFQNSVVSKSTDKIVEESNFERPKVIYNDKTKKYVMWVHRESKDSYKQAECAVLISDKVDGNYVWLKSFRPNNNMSRDCALFKDDDGSAYFISAANENADLKVYKLNDDYTDIEAEVTTLFAGKKREAPTIFKKDNIYYLITSACTGWDPNQAMYSTSKSMKGPWSELKNVGDNKTYYSQGTYILPVSGSRGTTYVFCADRWNRYKLDSSRYIWLPIEFNNGEIELNLYEKWKLQFEEGTWNKE